MRHIVPSGLLLAFALVCLGGRSGAAEPPTCEQAFAPVDAWVRGHMTDGPDARARMVVRLDGLLRRFGDEASDCAAGVWESQVRIAMLDERFEDAVTTASDFLSSPSAHRLPAVEVRVRRDRTSALRNLGREVEAAQEAAAAVALVPRLPAATAAATLRSYADQAVGRGDWASAGRAHRRAMRILLDSLRTDPDGIRLRVGRLLGSHAYLLQLRTERETDPGARRRLAHRLVRAAARSSSIVGAHRTEDPAEQTFDRGNRALTLTDGAYGAAVLGRHDEAAARMDEALALLTPDVRDVFPFAPSDVWLRRAETERLAGRLGAAARAAAVARAECEGTGDAACESFAFEALGRIAEEGGQLATAEGAYRTAIAVRDIEWEHGRLQDWNAATFAEVQGPYRGLTRVLVRQGRPEEAFSLLDGARARSLRDARAHLALRDGLTPARRLRLDSLLDAVRTERTTLLDDALSPESLATVAGRVSRLQARIADETRLRMTALGSVRLPQLQRTLGAQGRTLVSYLVGEAETLAFVVTPDTLVARTLPTGALDVRRLMARAGGPWRAGGADAAVRLEPLHALHERLVRPLRDDLPDSGGLVVVPDGPLADLPFGMLVEAPVRDGADARFLIRRYAVSTDLAAALVVEDAEQAPADLPLDLVAFGRGRFDGPGGTWRGRSGPLLANLPNVAAEIARVRDRVGNRETALDDEATEARFAAEAGRARVVHVASHAEADPAFPLYSRVYLWDDPGADDDGVVHLFELQGLRLPADLVVLSGCWTAAGQAQAGEGTIGLQYGVRAAGARAALATLWPVDDRATAEIVDLFYAALADGLPKDRALQRAQVTYLDRHAGAEASPYYWASAVLSGSPAPIALRGPAPVWPWGVGAVLLAAAGGLAWRTRRRPADAQPA